MRIRKMFCHCLDKSSSQPNACSRSCEHPITDAETAAKCRRFFFVGKAGGSVWTEPLNYLLIVLLEVLRNFRRAFVVVLK